MKNNKGAYLAVSEVMFFLLGLLVFVLIVGVFTEVREKTIAFATEKEFESIASYINYAIGQAYSLNNTTDNTSLSYKGVVFLDLPSTAGGHPYKTVFLNNSTMKVEATDNQSLSYTRTLYNITANMNGSYSSSGPKQAVVYDSSTNTILITPTPENV